MAPNFLFHPLLNEVEALTGVSDREVVDPSASRIDDFNATDMRLDSDAVSIGLGLSEQPHPSWCSIWSGSVRSQRYLSASPYARCAQAPRPPFLVDQAVRRALVYPNV
jgi:hypothetical protein